MRKLHGINNIIFDLGNVVLDVELDRAVKKFTEFGFSNAKQYMGTYTQKSFFHDLETGKNSENEFLNIVAQFVHPDTSLKSIKDAWNQILLEFDERRIKCLLNLQKYFDLYLLSNTNVIHLQNFENRVPIVGNINKLFKQTYYSHQIGLAKPNLEIYNWVIKDAGIVAEKTLFLDDSKTNIQAAEKTGLKGWEIKDPNNWVVAFEEWLKQQDHHSSDGRQRAIL